MSKTNNLSIYLACAGCLPFVLCMLLIVFKIKELPILGEVKEVLVTYAIIISSFMSGVHWGQHLNRSDKYSNYLAITSNVSAVSLWLAYLMLPFKGLLIFLALNFFTLLVIDNKLFKDKIITSKYINTRRIVSLTVITSLMISWVYA